MRPSAIVPILLGLAALVLSFLCLFAGTKTTFLPDYAFITLNTSQIGENVLNSSTITSNPIASSILSEIPDSIKGDIEDAVSSLAKRLGVHDFYNAHIMSYCEGYYNPTALPNATAPAKDIKKNFTTCSNTTAFFEFDPRAVLQNELDQSGNSEINVAELKWPSEIDTGLKALHTAQKAVFVLYCISAGIIGVATILAFISVCFSGRLSAFLNMLVAFVAFLAIGVASAIVTVIAVKARNTINKYGTVASISADLGGKFMALTWAATAAMFLCVIYWSIDCVIGRRDRRRSGYIEKGRY